ncbi:MAG: hypothetical protein JJT93_07330 [Gammaproteobacteria bacterium]|nr:hypothetical protein [Gammaproteobacteria bacterium]
MIESSVDRWDSAMPLASLNTCDRRQMPCRAGTAVALLLGVTLAFGATTMAEPGDDLPAPTGRFQSVTADTMDGAAFSFPEDLQGNPLVIGVAMSTSRANGEYQQGVLLEWQAWLDAEGVLPPGAAVYHFPVIESPPRFIRGAIRRAMRRTFADRVPDDRAAMLFVDDSAAFAAAAGLTLDDEPTLVLAAADGRPRWLFKGGPDEANTAALRRALEVLAGAGTGEASEDLAPASD